MSVCFISVMVMVMFVTVDVKVLQDIFRKGMKFYIVRGLEIGSKR